MPADITLVNLNMLFMRYGEEIERELHVPLGPLYLARALEDAGFAVDFRDYQCVPSEEPFDLNVLLEFLRDPAPVIGLSCMANLLPFTVLAVRALREAYPDRTIVLGGVGSKSVEEKLLARFPWLNIICRGEAEQTGPELLATLRHGGDLSRVPGLSYRANGMVHHTPDRPRITQLDTIPLPAFEKIDLAKYAGYGIMTSRGCPYPCTFCSVAPVWNHESYSRSAANIVDEMEYLHLHAGVGLFLFQDEFFVSGKPQVMTFCDELARRRLDIKWKAFGRINLVDQEMMQAMARTGCIELRFGIESGSDRVLAEIRKGFRAAETVAVVSQAVEIFPRVDCFFVWGFPFETLDDFHQTLFQMVAFRSLGARILPSLLSILPQTEIFRRWAEPSKLEFCPYLFPEFVVTGHEIYRAGRVELPEQHRVYFDLIRQHPDIFSGFFHLDLQGNVLPKLRLLQQFGFYRHFDSDPTDTETCGAHSPHVAPPELATRTEI